MKPHRATEALTNRAARSAIISSGLVGVTAGILTKGFNVDLAVSLPLAVATAIVLDYTINKKETEEAVQVLQEELKKFTGELSGSGDPTRSWFETQFLTAFLGLGWAATIALGKYIWIRGPQEQEVIRQAGQVALVAGRAAFMTWEMFVQAYVVNDGINLIGNMQQNAPNLFHEHVRPFVDDVVTLARESSESVQDVAAKMYEQLMEEIMPDVIQELGEQAMDWVRQNILVHMQEQAADIPDFPRPYDESAPSADLPSLPESPEKAMSDRPKPPRKYLMLVNNPVTGEPIALNYGERLTGSEANVVGIPVVDVTPDDIRQIAAEFQFSDPVYRPPPDDPLLEISSEGTTTSSSSSSRTVQSLSHLPPSIARPPTDVDPDTESQTANTMRPQLIYYNVSAAQVLHVLAMCMQLMTFCGSRIIDGVEYEVIGIVTPTGSDIVTVLLFNAGAAIPYRTEHLSSDDLQGLFQERPHLIRDEAVDPVYLGAAVWLNAQAMGSMAISFPNQLGHVLGLNISRTIAVVGFDNVDRSQRQIGIVNTNYLLMSEPPGGEPLEILPKDFSDL